MTTLCHSVFSLRSPVALSFQFSEVAMRMLTTSPPLLSERASGSAPRLPTRITLFTPAIEFSKFFRANRYTRSFAPASLGSVNRHKQAALDGAHHHIGCEAPH